MASLYKRGAVWYVKLRNSKGQWKYLSTGKSNRKDAEGIAAALVARLEHRGAVAHHDLTWEALRQRWNAWAALHRSGSLRELMRWAVETFETHTGCKSVGAVTREHIAHFKASRSEHGGEVSTNSVLRHLRSMVNRAIREGWYTGRNPFAGIEMLREQSQAPVFLTKSQIASVMAAAEQQGRNATMIFALGIYAGLRYVEIDGARWEWVQWDVGVLHVREGPGLALKDAENRHIPIHDRLLAALAPYRQDAGYIVAPEATKGRNRYRYHGGRQFMGALRRAGLAEQYVTPAGKRRWRSWVTPHVLRHTFASQLIMAGVSLDKVSIWLGHSDPRTTRIYAHLAPRDEDINRLGR